MRHLWLTATLAVPLLFISPNKADANPPPNLAQFGCAGYCFKMFKHIHQHGPLFNYGPYYGYYPFAPYGPWDAYLRYDPNFYGNTGAALGGNAYGLNPGFLPHVQAVVHHFSHASWLHGGWYRGHKWLDGGHGDAGAAPACSSCGGVAEPTGPDCGRDPLSCYSGVGRPAQSAVFYKSAPTLNPVLDVARAK
jgi:hypothetical protein